MDPEISSNWKALQKKLGISSKSKALKRKRSVSFISDNQIRRGANVEIRPSTSVGALAYEIEKPIKNEGVSPTALPGKYIALDCEFVGVGPPPHSDNQLARVSLVNWHGQQVYDTFVLPQLPVTDYRTAISGVRAEDLEDGRPFAQVRTDVATFLQNRILVGHWLRSDLKCLQLQQHPHSDIRDTALLTKFKMLLGTNHVKLQDLAKKCLGLDIQTGEHDSIEDARTAMMLFKTNRDDFERKARQSKPPPTVAINLFDNDKVKHPRKATKCKRR